VLTVDEVRAMRGLAPLALSGPAQVLDSPEVGK
jgi:hypothetical protein